MKSYTEVYSAEIALGNQPLYKLALSGKSSKQTCFVTDRWVRPGSCYSDSSLVRLKLCWETFHHLRRKKMGFKMIKSYRFSFGAVGKPCILHTECAYFLRFFFFFHFCMCFSFRKNNFVNEMNDEVDWLLPPLATRLMSIDQGQVFGPTTRLAQCTSLLSSCSDKQDIEFHKYMFSSFFIHNKHHMKNSSCQQTTIREFIRKISFGIQTSTKNFFHGLVVFLLIPLYNALIIRALVLCYIVTT